MLDTWLAPYNLLFSIPIALAALFILLQLIGLSFGLGDGHAGVDLDPAVDLSIDHGIDHGIDFTESGLEADADAGAALALLSFMNFGRAPFSLLLSIFSFGFGISGLFATTWLRRNTTWSSFEALALGGTALALPMAVVTTRLLGGLFARLLPDVDSKGMNPTTMLAREAVVDSVELSSQKGRGHVIDDDGDIHTVFIRLADSESGSFPKGTRVTLLRYRAKQGLYIVEPLHTAPPDFAQDSTVNPEADSPGPDSNTGQSRVAASDEHTPVSNTAEKSEATGLQKGMTS